MIFKTLKFLCLSTITLIVICLGSLLVDPVIDNFKYREQKNPEAKRFTYEIIELLTQRIQDYYQANSCFPPSLKKLKEDKSLKNVLWINDGWNRPFFYLNLENAVIIVTTGADGKVGGHGYNEDQAILVSSNFSRNISIEPPVWSKN